MTWQANDDNCFEMVRKAVDEMDYQHHAECMEWLEKKLRLARLGAAVEAMPADHALHRAGEFAGSWLILKFVKFDSRTNDYVCEYVPSTEEKTALQALTSFAE